MLDGRLGFRVLDQDRLIRELAAQTGEPFSPSSTPCPRETSAPGTCSTEMVRDTSAVIAVVFAEDLLFKGGDFAKTHLAPAWRP